MASALAGRDRDPARAVLEAIALEGYRMDRLSEYQVQQLLGFDYFEDVHRFLNDHGLYPPHTLEELDRDAAVALNAAQTAGLETGSRDLL